jgi:hypothetical protein
MFRKVSTQEFKQALAKSGASPAFRKHFARYISFDPYTDTCRQTDLQVSVPLAT